MNENGDFNIESVSSGLQQITDDEEFAVFAGRVKLEFEVQRLGGKSLYHIGRDIFFTKYKAVVLRNGSPLKENINRVLHRLHNGGIIDKMTQVYPKILFLISNIEKTREIAQDEIQGITARTGQFGEHWKKKYKILHPEQESTLRPVSIAVLSAAFLTLAFGNILAFLAFIVELFIKGIKLQKASKARHATFLEMEFLPTILPNYNSIVPGKKKNINISFVNAISKTKDHPQVQFSYTDFDLPSVVKN